MNSVRYLLDNKPLSKEDKMAVKALGRPMPNLHLTSTIVCKTREFNRYFKRENTYGRFPWMCGCPETNRLFCFVCLIGGATSAAQWCSTGVSDLRHLQQRATSHAQNAAHLNQLVDFSVLGVVDVQTQLSGVYLKGIKDHNEKVDGNRRALQRLVVQLKLSGALGLELYSQDQLDFQGLPSEFELLSQPTVLQKDPKLARNQLLDAMLQVCKKEIVDQVTRSNFVALIVEELDDQHLVVIFRYVFENQIFERFWSVVRLEEYTVQNISHSLLEELDSLGIDSGKLISQSSNMASNTFGRVQSLIRDRYPNAALTQSYSHHFLTVMENAASGNKEMRIFFAHIQAFADFFSHSAQRIAILDELVQKNLPWIGTKSWNFKTGTVKELYGQTELFRECLHKIIDGTNEGITVSSASGLLNILDLEGFGYLLEVVNSIVPHVEMFFNRMQSRTASHRFVQQCLRELEEDIFKKVKEQDEPVASNAADHEPASKRRRVGSSESALELYETQIKIDIDEISEMAISTTRPEPRHPDSVQKSIVIAYCSALIDELEKLYEFTGYMSAAALFCSDMFRTYKTEFLDTTLEETTTSYPFIEKAKLNAELTAIYTRTDMSCEGLLPLLVFMYRNNLKEGFSETCKLLGIICTTPMVTCEAERCSSAVERIKNCVGNLDRREKLSALTMLSVERKMVQAITDFDNKVIDIFAEGEHGMDFKYLR